MPLGLAAWRLLTGALSPMARLLLEAFRCDPKRVSALRTELEGLLAKAEIALFFKRLETVVSRGCWPPMTTRRSVPWPWY